MFRNRSEDRQRKLYVFQGECKGKVFGIVRSTWYRGGKICRVQETKLRDSFDTIVNTAKFSPLLARPCVRAATFRSILNVSRTSWA